MESENLITANAGIPVLAEEYPYLVAIFYNGTFVCAGSIISTLYVLTAAHCVFSSKFPYTSQFKVVAGMYNTTDGGQESQIRQVSIIKSHENYNQPKYENDIAVMLLSEPLVYTSTVQNVSLPRRNESYADDYIELAGWEMFKYARNASLELRKAYVSTIPSTACQNRYYGGFFAIMVALRCKGKTGGRLCGGYSGGPAMRYVGDSTTVQYGIASFGRACARNDAAGGAYTLVDQYIDWIEQKTT